MTITHTLNNIISNPVGGVADLKVGDIGLAAGLAPIDTPSNPKDGNSSHYVVAAGNPDFPTTLVRRSATTVKGDSISKRISQTVQTSKLHSDAATELIKGKGISCQISWVYDGTEGEVTSADLRDCLRANIRALCSDGLAEGDPIGDVAIAKLMFGVTQI